MGLQQYDNVTSAAAVKEIFHANPPQRGNTDLTGALDAVFEKCRAAAARPAAVLIVTDGKPNDESTAKRSIERFANELHSVEQAALTFMQIGDDQGASVYLSSLDDSLQCKYDIVDVIKDDFIREWGFEKLFAASLQQTRP